MKKLAILILALAVLMTVQSSILKISKNLVESVHLSNKPQNFEEFGPFNGKFRRIETQKENEKKSEKTAQVQQEEKQENTEEESHSRNNTPKTQNNKTKKSNHSEGERLVKNKVNFTQQPKKDTEENHNKTGKKNVRLLQIIGKDLSNFTSTANRSVPILPGVVRPLPSPTSVSAPLPVPVQIPNPNLTIRPIINIDVKQDPRALKAYNYLLSELFKEQETIILSATKQIINNNIAYNFELKIIVPQNVYFVYTFRVVCLPNNTMTIQIIQKGKNVLRQPTKQSMSFIFTYTQNIYLFDNMTHTTKKEDLKYYPFIYNEIKDKVQSTIGAFEFDSAFYFEKYYIIMFKAVKGDTILTVKLVYQPNAEPLKKLQILETSRPA